MIRVQTSFSNGFGLRMPLIMAPMFLVSNEAMMQCAMDEGVMGVFPSLNFRKPGELSELLSRLNAYREAGAKPGNYGVNLIVQRTNRQLDSHLLACVEAKVPFYITSLGNPSEVIREAHAYGAQVYCDVTNLQHARKAVEAGADGVIAVTQGAGGHAGPDPMHILIPAMREAFPDLPVIAAGGIATGSGIVSALSLGASGVSMGTRFIASNEAGVSQAYKDAIVKAGIDDIMLTERLSGTPCAVIATPEARRLGERQNAFERFLNKNPWSKRTFKLLTQYRGLKRLEKAVLPGTYDAIWSAGQSVAFIHDVLPCREIIRRLMDESEQCMNDLNQRFSQD
ncbi:MAG: nitronate monooxygenase family protein [Sphingobacteriales bacterium]|nr:nitronate monooxygenase family protein [Sphingobacteriales bacterium]